MPLAGFFRFAALSVVMADSVCFLRSFYDVCICITLKFDLFLSDFHVIMAIGHMLMQFKG